MTIVWPFEGGDSSQILADNQEPEPAKTWKSKKRNASPTEASAERFEQQIKAWVTPGQIELARPINPSSIGNRALTEVLRGFVVANDGDQRVEVPVTYNDGSSARSFPMRARPMFVAEPNDQRSVMKVTLLSVRHLDMDVYVDGAWLRNREISLPRPAAETDEIVYQQSRKQLSLISRNAPVSLHLYQTGLPAANVGFYRALIDHHCQTGIGWNPVAVVPFYYMGTENDESKFDRSKRVWAFR